MSQSTPIQKIDQKIEDLRRQREHLIREYRQDQNLCDNCLQNGRVTRIITGFNCQSCIEDMRDPPW
jgi:hypothetical protein